MRSRTNQDNITTRRAVLTGATIATAAGVASAAVLRSTIASAVERDPIFDLIAKADRLLAEANAATARYAAICKAAGGALDGGWPLVDQMRPEFRRMRQWFRLHCPDGRPHRTFIEHYNTRSENIVAAMAGEEWPDAIREEWEKRHAEGLARLAHWDDLRGQYERLAESTGYRAAIKQSEELYCQWGNVISEISEAQAVTVAGALAQLKVAADGIKDNHTLDGEFTGDVDDVGVINAYEALARLLVTV